MPVHAVHVCARWVLLNPTLKPKRFWGTAQPHPMREKVLGDENITGRRRMKITIMTRMAIIKDNKT